MDIEEKKRLDSLFLIEKKVQAKGYRLIAGIDEVGRGPLAGPVVAAACILTDPFAIQGINDSKKLTPAKRKEIHDRLINNETVFYGIGVVDAQVIDQINILQASLLAMKKAIENLSKEADYLLIDGKYAPQLPNYPYLCIVKGDTLSLSIAAASILAKYHRDSLMDLYHDKWPHFGFKKHKGYATMQHQGAIHAHGICPIHRKSFAPIAAIIEKNI